MTVTLNRLSTEVTHLSPTWTGHFITARSLYKDFGALPTLPETQYIPQHQKNFYKKTTKTSNCTNSMSVNYLISCIHHQIIIPISIMLEYVWKYFLQLLNALNVGFHFINIAILAGILIYDWEQSREIKVSEALWWFKIYVHRKTNKINALCEKLINA